MDTFRKIGIIGRLGSAQIIETLKRLKHYLLGCGYEVVIENDISPLLPAHGLRVLSRKDIGNVCDLAIVVGGDGSMLGAARALAGTLVPVLGINRGNLGFLTDISADQLEDQIDDVLKGNYSVEKRFLIEVKVLKKGKLINQGRALNEIVLHPGRFTKMIEFELFIDDQFVMSQKSDGMIVTTPTGSTAYALSAGGSIMHPGLNAIALIPMYPHTLNNRPLVVDADSKLKIKISKTDSVYSQISCDGQIYLNTCPGDELHLNKAEALFHLIHPVNHNYFEICRTKLNWGHRLGNKKYLS